VFFTIVFSPVAILETKLQAASMISIENDSAVMYLMHFNTNMMKLMWQNDKPGAKNGR